MTRTITPTHVLLSQVTLAASAADVTFSSLPPIYGDLVLVCRVNGTSSAGGLTFQLRFNLDSGNSYHDLVMGASSGGSFSNAVSPGNGLRLSYSGTNGTETCFITAHIMDYSSSDKHKSIISRHAGTADGNRTDLFTGRWVNTVPITSVTVRPDANSIAANSTFALYGVHA